MKTKSILTLFVGIVIGVLAGGRFTMHKIHKAKDMRTERGFMKHVFESFDLEEQSKDSVRVIMEGFARFNHQKHEALQQEMHEVHLNLEKDLSKFLSEQELKKLKKIMRHRNHKGRKGKGSRRFKH